MLPPGSGQGGAPSFEDMRPGGLSVVHVCVCLCLCARLYMHAAILYVLFVTVITTTESQMAYLARQPQFVQLRQVLQNNPALLQPILQQIGQSNPELLQVQ